MSRIDVDQKPWRVRTQLLMAVNIPLGICLVLLLVWDYRREIDQAADTKQANLANEAVAIHRAVSHLLAERNKEGVQSYLDSVCHQMRSGGARHHTILVESQTSVFSSHRAHESNPELLSALTSTPSREVVLEGDLLIVGRSSQPGMAVYITESLTDARRQVRRLIFGRLAALAALGLVAMLLVNFVVLQIVGRPIRMLVQTVDRIRTGDYIEPEGPFSTREFAKLAAAVSLMSKTLRENEERRQIQIEKAREIQQHLLPSDIAVPGLAVAAWFAPAEHVAGDYYDVIPLPDGSWLIALADISGHGVPSALEAAMLKVLLGNAALQTHDPAEILQLINKDFVSTVPEGDFASAFLLRWIPEKNRVEYANAGHIPGLYRNAHDGIAGLEATGFLIGVDENAAWETQVLSIRGNEHLLIVSDGVIESQSESGALFGRRKLLALFQETMLQDPNTMIQRLQAEISAFTAESALLDDITALAIQFTADQTTSQAALASSAHK